MTAAQLKERRISNGWDQARAASELEVSIHTIRAWEQGKNPVPAWVERRLLTEIDLKVPLEIISEINEIASAETLSFDAALAAILRRGLRASRPGDPDHPIGAATSPPLKPASALAPAPAVVLPAPAPAPKPAASASALSPAATQSPTTPKPAAKGKGKGKAR